MGRLDWREKCRGWSEVRNGEFFYVKGGKSEREWKRNSDITPWPSTIWLAVFLHTCNSLSFLSLSLLVRLFCSHLWNVYTRRESEFRSGLGAKSLLALNSIVDVGPSDSSPRHITRYSTTPLERSAPTLLKRSAARCGFSLSNSRSRPLSLSLFSQLPSFIGSCSSCCTPRARSPGDPSVPAVPHHGPRRTASRLNGIPLLLLASFWSGNKSFLVDPTTHSLKLPCGENSTPRKSCQFTNK